MAYILKERSIMLKSRIASALALTCGLSLAGCNVDVVDVPMGTPPKSTLAGGQGVNGEDTNVTSLFERLEARMGAPIVSPTQPHEIDPTTASYLLQDSLGEGFMKYVIRSALPESYLVTYSATGWEAKGGGYLSRTMETPNDWLTGVNGMTPDARKDLIAILGIWLNGYGVHVPVGIKGRFVARNDDLTKYYLPEAVWIAKNVNDQHFINVWAHPTFRAACGEKVDAAIYTRVCGTPDGECPRVVVRQVFTTACIADTAGYYRCDGIDALESFLNPTPEDLQGSYSECGFF
jgi:hypothetical protein